jgi:hypothetical protein
MRPTDMSVIARVLRRSPAAGLFGDAVKWTRAPRTMRRLMADARTTRDECAFMRTLPPAAPGARKALILSMSDWPYQVKIECMLALELRRRGWSVRALTSNVYSGAKRIFAAYGITDFVSFEKLVWDPKLYRRCVAEAARLAAGPTDFASVKEWTYRDAWIGPQILATVSRKTFNGTPDPTDPAARAELLRQLPLAIGFVHAAERYFDAQRPDVILVNEPNSTLGPFVDVAIARGIPIIHFIQPSREDALVFKCLTRETRRIHPHSISAAMLDRLAAEPWTGEHERALDEEFRRRYGGVWRVQQRNQPGTVEMSAQEIRGELGLDGAKPTAVLFSHVLWDANLFYGRDLFDNYGHWFVETVKAAAANPNLNWLIKLHPANLWKRELAGVTSEYNELRLIREAIGELPEHLHLLEPKTPISTLSLFRMADAGITVRGSIGYEMPCFGVPVVTAGTGRNSGFGFTLDHDSADDYRARLARLHTVPRLGAAAVHRAKVHAYALMARRPWVFSSFRATVGSDVTDPLCQNLHVAAKSFAAIADNGDLAAFGDWITNHGGVDYLSVDSLATAKARSAQPLVALTQTSLASPARPGDPVNIGRE